MATRYRHVRSGAVVSVRDGKAMDADWAPIKSNEKPAQRGSAKKAAPAKSSDDES